jgi:hypothetical protein
MTQKVMPHTLAFRSGWAPGDLFMLVECYPRHDPLNPTAIVGLERYGASLAEMASEKFISRENAVSIVDLSGTAAYLGQKGFRGEKRLPVGHAGMETAVPAFSDHALATHATVAVSNYMGFRATQQREFLFVKNRFVLVRDETRFDDRFRASVGPAWNTQHVGQPRGDHWLNTWFTAHFFEDKRLFDVPPWDLLIWYAPRPGAGLEVGEPAEKSPAGSKLVATRYAWQGDVEPGARIQSVTVLLPHAPLRDASSLAIGIKPLADRPGLAAVEIAQDGRCELAVLNPEGGKIELNCAAARPVITDGRAVYIDLGGGPSRRAVVVQGTTLKVGAEELLRADERKNFEIAP